MINYFKAISIILNQTQKKINFLEKKKINIFDSIYKINIYNLYSNKNIPYFKSSAMDGYAINFNNTYINKKIKIKKKVKTGDLIEYKNINKNDSIEITTGSRIPSIFDSVIKIEDTEKKNNCVYIKNKKQLGSNIKLIGEDFKIGENFLKKGKIINNNDILILSTLGFNYIDILLNPKIFLINTGNEISNKLTKINTKIANNSGSYIKMYLKKMNIKVNDLGISKDEFKFFIKKIKNIWFKNKIIIFITTGAISKGGTDFIPKLFNYLGINILFKSVNIKPGKPIMFSKYKFNIFFFSLPGNPISTIIGLRFFFTTFIRSLLGQNLENPIIYKKKHYITNNKTHFFKSHTMFNKNKIKTLILNNQESFKVKPMIVTNSFVLLISKKNNFYNIYFNEFFI